MNLAPLPSAVYGAGGSPLTPLAGTSRPVQVVVLTQTVAFIGLFPFSCGLQPVTVMGIV